MSKLIFDIQPENESRILEIQPMKSVFRRLRSISQTHDRPIENIA